MATALGMEASLVSAFDIHKGILGLDDIYGSDILFVDSGGYEARRYEAITGQGAWTVADYLSILEQLKPHTSVVAVSFDYSEAAPLPVQIVRARELSRRFPSLMIDFLWKPEPGECTVSPPDLAKQGASLRDFHVLGVTADELGHSVNHRCRAVAEIRRALDDHGLEIPIHIFGCLDPVLALAYHLAGADVFDGLAWLRGRYHEQTLQATFGAALVPEMWTQTDAESAAADIEHNVRLLMQVERKMATASETGHLDAFAFGHAGVAQLQAMVTALKGEGER